MATPSIVGGLKRLAAGAALISARRAAGLGVLALILSLIGCARTTATREVRQSTTAPVSSGSIAEEKTPALADEEPLLLLDEEPISSVSAPGTADNSRCFVCHLDYETEELAVTHARAEIGCADCHGESDAHIADESWASGGNGTPPDIMFLESEIQPACMQCHPQAEIDTEPHEALFSPSGSNRVCTDCHGDHLLPQRRRQWK
jgi:hypothetical protein